MIDELSTKFTSDAPSQSAQPRAARRKDQRELRGHIEISAIIRTPPSDMSVMVHSRGREPTPN
jgi:hypothetical protein